MHDNHYPMNYDKHYRYAWVNKGGGVSGVTFERGANHKTSVMKYRNVQRDLPSKVVPCIQDKHGIIWILLV